MRMVAGVAEVVDVVVEGRGMVVVVDIGNGDGGKWLSLELLIFRFLLGISIAQALVRLYLPYSNT